MLKIATPILTLAALVALATPAAADPFIQVSDPYACHSLYANVPAGGYNRLGAEVCPVKP